ncbi:hypothetical protein CEXT_726721 [Caerostris extrusa]|uniref:Uncharacterized protein n=1 Tax=Caerostris extrusa TaxID=172846 RepID=A0AAV4PDE4_CAEEX|nr:hypothetical protein CEXT_726721 [Caerostris extrusa]
MADALCTWTARGPGEKNCPLRKTIFWRRLSRGKLQNWEISFVGDSGKGLGGALSVGQDWRNGLLRNGGRMSDVQQRMKSISFVLNTM